MQAVSPSRGTHTTLDNGPSTVLPRQCVSCQRQWPLSGRQVSLGRSGMVRWALLNSRRARLPNNTQTLPCASLNRRGGLAASGRELGSPPHGRIQGLRVIIKLSSISEKVRKLECLRS